MGGWFRWAALWKPGAGITSTHVRQPSREDSVNRSRIERSDLEPTGPPNAEDRLLEEIRLLRKEGVRAALATVIGVDGSSPAHAPMKLLVREDGTALGSVGGGCLEEDVKRLAQEVILEERTARFRMRLTAEDSPDSALICGGTVEVFLEPVTAPNLLLFGGGHVSRAVAGTAARLGFRVVVTDDRPEYTGAERFPMAAESHALPVEDAAAALSVGASSFVLVMTRSHALDEEVLYHLHERGARPRYLGMIGSATKVRRTWESLSRRGVGREWLRSVRAPVGLKIGSRSAEEIAVAVGAELVAVRRGVERIRWAASTEQGAD